MRAFNENETYTDEGCKISDKAMEFVNQLLKNHPEIQTRDIQHLVADATALECSRERARRDIENRKIARKQGVS